MFSFEDLYAQNIDVSDGHITAYDTQTKGPAILCIPGLGDTAQSYRHLIPLLIEAGHRVVTMDLRGHGSSAATFKSYSGADIGRDAIAVLDALKITDAMIIGCSIGGGSAVWLAAEVPSRVTRLVLINPFTRDVRADDYFRPLVPILFARFWGAWFWGVYFRTLFPTKPEGLKEYSKMLVRNLKKPGHLLALRTMLRTSKQELELRLVQVTSPTQIIMGGADPDFPDPYAEGKWLSAQLAGPTSVDLMEGLGHYPHVEAPDQTAALILGITR